MSNGSFGGLIDTLVNHYRGAQEQREAPSLKGIKAAALAILAEGTTGDDLVEQFVGYEVLLDRVDLTALVPTDRELLTEIVALHGRVLAKAETLRGELAEELRGIRSKGRGLLAYAESMVPKGSGEKKRAR